MDFTKAVAHIPRSWGASDLAEEMPSVFRRFRSNADEKNHCPWHLTEKVAEGKPNTQPLYLSSFEGKENQPNIFTFGEVLPSIGK